MNDALYLKPTPHTQNTQTVFRAKDGKVLGYIWPASNDLESNLGWYARPRESETAVHRSSRDLAIAALREAMK